MRSKIASSQSSTASLLILFLTSQPLNLYLDYIFDSATISSRNEYINKVPSRIYLDTLSSHEGFLESRSKYTRSNLKIKKKILFDVSKFATDFFTLIKAVKLFQRSLLQVPHGHTFLLDLHKQELSNAFSVGKQVLEI